MESPPSRKEGKRAKLKGGKTRRETRHWVPQGRKPVTSREDVPLRDRLQRPQICSTNIRPKDLGFLGRSNPSQPTVFQDYTTSIGMFTSMHQASVGL
ncbi:hypothetical protein AVEN_273080-1, partial [Araneus ventricosus]